MPQRVVLPKKIWFKGRDKMLSFKPAVSRMAFILLLVPLFASAGVFRWVDEEGNVHFGDAPPAKQDCQEVIVDKEPATRAQEQEQAKQRWDKIIQEQERRRAARLKRAEDQRALLKAKKQEKAVREQRCHLARHNLQALLTRRPVYRLNQEGERVYVDDEQRTSEVRRTKEEIEEYCDQ